MAAKRPRLLLPVENLVREFDAKLLLACIAAERGHTVVLGYRTQLDFQLSRFPASLYLAKGMTNKSEKVFRILRLLGSRIAVSDEESLVYHTPEHYYGRKISPATSSLASLLLAWGPDNAELWRKYPHWAGTPIHVVGHPRVDLLRPELRSYFDDEVRELRERHGRFVLINTNFAMVNAFLDIFNVFRKPAQAGARTELGAAGIGAPPGFAAGYAAHKTALFEAFQALLPRLSSTFPEHKFILRRHPGESSEVWEAIARSLPKVEICHEGNVVPWLLASDALIHNGCTTAVEAVLLGTPSISYRPRKQVPYDLELPNAVSHEVDDSEALCSCLQKILSGELGCPDATQLAAPLATHLSSLDGALSSERIIDVLETSPQLREGLQPPSLGEFLRGWYRTKRRSFVKQNIRARRSDSRNNPEVQRHRFQGMEEEAVRAKVERLGRSLGRFSGLEVETLSPNIFQITK